MRVNETKSPLARAEATPGRFGELLRSHALRRADPKPPRQPMDAAGLRASRHDETQTSLSPAAATLTGSADLAPVPELAALVRALPAAIDAARVRDGSPLALSFGRSLEVDLRSGAAGIEVVLRPDPRLARAADAELPRIVAALRARGIAVGRAEVRPREGRRAAR
jgi:hypothetical protein